jgi:hypothetical protein
LPAAALSLNKIIAFLPSTPTYPQLRSIFANFSRSTILTIPSELLVMGTQFEYQRLVRPEREIRLLELLPSTHKLSKFRPACRIFHASLDENPSFLALSYVWGDASDKRTILVDKRPFRVTRNLFNAMMGLRETHSLIIWIDAICINQADDEEKGWQVRLMGAIYRQASGVLAWFGASADNSDTVIDYLQILGERAEKCGLHDGPEPCMRIWQAITTRSSYMDDPDEVVSLSRLDGRLISVSKIALKRLLDSISGEESQEKLLPIADLKRFFRRAWWGRVWVLQEITLPERASFACGTKRISRQRLRAAFNACYALRTTLTLKAQQPQRLTAYQFEVVLMASQRASVMLSMSSIYQTRMFPLVALLRSTCVGSVHHLQQDGYQHLESTNPRDKIFALLGLAKDQEELETLGVFPDYTKPREEVYITAMAALLRQGHTSLLSHCRTSRTRSNLPSWVIDWSVCMLETLQDVEPDHLTLYPRFTACGPKVQNHIIIPDMGQEPAAITALANIYDKVLRIGDVHRVDPTGTCVFGIDWLYEILRLSYEVQDIYADFDGRLHAVVRTSHAAIGYGADAKLQRVDRFYDALRIFKANILRIKRKDIRLYLRYFLAGTKVLNLLRSGCGDPSRLFNEFMRMTSGRSPFVTEKGHLGLGSRYVRGGDIVALIGGAQVPFILRQQEGGKYSIVSEAYVDGIMDGKAAETGEWRHIELV